MILCNGSPKSGTHLLARAVALFGDRSIHHGHISYALKVNYQGKHIHIRRVPRNIILSNIRFFQEGKIITPSLIIKTIPKVIKEVYSYVPWLSAPNILNISFEKLLTDQSELRGISEYLGTPLVENHFRKMWGRTATFTGELSNWRNHWTDKISEVYKAEGGYELESLLGYDPDNEQPYVRTADAL